MWSLEIYNYLYMHNAHGKELSCDIRRMRRGFKYLRSVMSLARFTQDIIDLKQFSTSLYK